jgi:hypothetical protein
VFGELIGSVVKCPESFRECCPLNNTQVKDGELGLPERYEVSVQTDNRFRHRAFHLSHDW